MVHIIYDGSFIGLINAYNYIFSNEITPTLIGRATNFQTNFLAKEVYINSEPNNYEQFLLFLTRKGLKYLEEPIYKTYLASPHGFEILIYNVIQEHLSERGEQLFWKKFERIIKKIDKALIQLESGIRFKEEKGYTFFASISPEYNLLPLLAKNLTKKFPHTWVIYDEKRKYGLEYDLEKLECIQFSKLAHAC
ncbi:MAG TPA: DUF4130 domain-containing protein [Cytophagaceae bacterium]